MPDAALLLLVFPLPIEPHDAKVAGNVGEPNQDYCLSFRSVAPNRVEEIPQERTRRIEPIRERGLDQLKRIEPKTELDRDIAGVARRRPLG